MMKIENDNVTIEAESILDTLVESSLMLHAAREVFIDELGVDKADRLIASIGLLASMDENILCNALAELQEMMKDKRHDS